MNSQPSSCKTVIKVIALAAWLTAQAKDYSQTLPAFTAYAHPSPDDISRHQNGSITDWHGTLHWHVLCAHTGELSVRVIPLENQSACTLSLTAAGSTQTAPMQGKPVAFSITIAVAGYVELMLSCTAGQAPGLQELVLSGNAAQGLRASKVERRNCASVHLAYEVQKADADSVEWFYCELTPRTDPIWTYYMATGWSRGYFGMQVNAKSERRIIFSVWDSGNEAVNRAKVKADDRVQLIAKGEGVEASDFGNEGTGGHSHRVTPWILGGTFGFLVHAKAEGSRTTYTGWYRAPLARDWQLIASFRAPKDGALLRGLYSFDENFAGANGDVRRDCEFGNTFARTTDGAWHELSDAHFTHDGHGKSLRTDRSGGVHDNRFYLRSGGFAVDNDPSAVTHYGDLLQRKPSGSMPAALQALPIPPSMPKDR
ncbi:MAG: DUF3472 domain-containing protein [Planctomycetota bacterium]|nr:DUF3472 domain-containing protein [Planctomycetota bacterium]